MSWKEKLGIANSIFSEEIDEHFKKLGFYEHTMNPRFFGNINNRKITEDLPVLRFDGDWDNGGVQRVFMNQKEMYVERQTNYRSFDGSDYYEFETPPTSIKEIEDGLNEIVKKYNG